MLCRFLTFEPHSHKLMMNDELPAPSHTINELYALFVLSLINLGFIFYHVWISLYTSWPTSCHIIRYVSNPAKGYNIFTGSILLVKHLIIRRKRSKFCCKQVSPCVHSCGRMLYRTRRRLHWSCSPAPCPHKPGMSCPSSGRSWMPLLRNRDSSGHIPTIGEETPWPSSVGSLFNIYAD